MKTLKKIVTFYLGSWWLPQVVAITWAFCGYCFTWYMYISTTVGDGALFYYMGVILGIIFFCAGWLVTWICLLFHKRWKNALFSFLLALPPLAFTILALIPFL